MDHQTSRSAPPPVIEALDASVRDIAEGNVHAAQAVQAEARRMLAAHERTRPAGPGPSPGRPARRTRTA